MNTTHVACSPALGTETLDIPYEVWSAPGVEDAAQVPLLLAHDGPEYDERSGLTKFLTQQVRSGILPPHRVALIEPVFGQRNNWYGASPDYNAALAQEIIPTIIETYPTSPRIIGMGASLGAVSLLGIAHENPELFTGLFLQSGSFHHPNIDHEPGDYGEYPRVAKIVDKIVRAKNTEKPMDITLTCGRYEANLTGNVVIFSALKAQGHTVEFVDTKEEHTFESWGRLFNPHLSHFLRRVWKK